MNRFKVGQKVVALKTHADGEFKKGEIYIIDGFSCCPMCGRATVYLLNHNEIVNSTCTICGHKDKEVRVNFYESNFAPIENIADAIEYKMKVSIPELIEIKEYQNQ